MNDHKDIVFRKVTYPGVQKDSYLVSEDGAVYSVLRDKILSPEIDKDGYLKITLKGKHVRINRLVAYEYCPKNRDLKLVVNHIDGNKQNNHYTNLEWITVKENTNHAEQMGLRNVKGSANGNSRYPEEFIHDICRLFEEGKSNMEVYRMFRPNINNSHPLNQAFYKLLTRLRKREIWTEVTSQYKYDSDLKSIPVIMPNPRSRFNIDQVHEICKLAESGMNASDILSRLFIKPSDPDYNKKLQGVHEIMRGRNWKYISSQYNLPEVKHISEILKFYGITNKTDNPGLQRAIMRRISKYNKMLSLPEGISININSVI